MSVIKENFVRQTQTFSFSTSTGFPLQILPDDPNRLWASVLSDFDNDDEVVISANAFSKVGDPDGCYMSGSQSGLGFQTYGTNALYIVGMTGGQTQNFGLTTCVKIPAPVLNLGQDSRCATRIITECGGGPVSFVSGFAPLLPADPTRRRAYIRVDNTNLFSAVTDGVVAANFMPIVPYFPGWTVVEGTEALAFADFGTGPTSAWWIVDREVPA